MQRFLLLLLMSLCVWIPYGTAQIVIPAPVPDPAGPYFDNPPNVFPIPPFGNRSDLVVNDGDRVEVYASFEGSQQQVAVFQDYIEARFTRVLSLTNFENPTTIRLVQQNTDSSGYHIMVASDSPSLIALGEDGYDINLIRFDGGNISPESFTTEVVYSHMTQSEFPPQTAVGDIDGDGDNDVLINFPTVLSDETPSVMWLRNDEPLGYVPLDTGINLPGLPGNNRNAKRLLLHDMNNDGRLDLIFLLEFFSDQRGVLVFEGQGNGQFIERGPISSPNFPLNVDVYPFAEDALPGLVVHESPLPDQASIYRFRQTAPFVFEPVGAPVPVGPLSYDMKVEDLNQDGSSDVAVSFGDLIQGTANLRILKYQDGVADPVVIQDVPLDYVPGKFVFTNLNGDPFLDLIYAGILSAQQQNENLTVLLQRPVWVTPTPLPTSTPTMTPDATNTPLPTATFTPSMTPSSTPTHTPTPTPTPTVTHTPSPSPTDTPEPTSTALPTNTPTNTPTSTPSVTPSHTPTNTPTNTPTHTPTNTSTPTVTPTPTVFVTPTPLPFDLDRFREQYTRVDVENAGQGIRDLAIADVWNEGRGRLLVVASEEDIVRVIGWQDGTTTIDNLFTDDDPHAIHIIEDGSIALASHGGPHMTFLEPTTPGAVELLDRVSLLEEPISIHEFDFTLDGLPDLLLQSRSSREISILEALGDSSYSLDESVQIGEGAVAFDTYVNREGQSFIASINPFSTRLTLLRVLNGGLLIPQGDFAAGIDPVSVGTGRVDDDEHIDVVIADRSGRTVIAWTTNGTSSIQRRIDLTLSEEPSAVEMHDFTRDGLDDVIVAGARDESVILYVEQLWDQPLRFETAMHAEIITAGDLNGDGVIDFAAASADDPRLTLYISENATAVHEWFIFD